MLSVTNKDIMLSDIALNVVILSVVEPSRQSDTLSDIKKFSQSAG